MHQYSLKFFERSNYNNSFEGRLEFQNKPNSENKPRGTEGTLTIIRPSDGERESCKLNGTNWWPPTPSSDFFSVTLEGKDPEIPHAYLSLMPSFKKVSNPMMDVQWGIAGEAKIKMDENDEEKLYLVIGEGVA